MNPRFHALLTTGERNIYLNESIDIFKPLDQFGKYVFNLKVMEKMLSRKVFNHIQAAIDGEHKIEPQYADQIAIAMKEWAQNLGATHYCHWFQPLTGATAEKHEAFLEWFSDNKVLDKFSGSQLIQGEPDASSFPSGGLRTTFEARGYTGWDPSTPVFVWRGGDGIVLCIPSIFFSWTGAVLDNKIPLLRSEKLINDAGKRLLKLCGKNVKKVFSTLGVEQEYFVIDRALRNLRPDLLLTGRTILGASSPKGQELQDHYFATIKDRILCFMHDFEKVALGLGIPIKTRHNEVAPAQHEVTPFFEKSSLAIDHNILLMEVMRHVALKHNLACLLHEKPFQHLNGSGKHCNWSLATDTGINLLNPTNNPENNLPFLILVTAILYGIHKYSKLLRASIGSYENDFRLGGHEAPPAIISVYLGKELENILNEIEKNGKASKSNAKTIYDLGINLIPDLSKDNIDRNRTSPFAFTGNKFEFRALGSSASPAMAITSINLIVAEGINVILDEIEESLDKDQKDILPAVLPVLRKYLKLSKKIRFDGDNYCDNWITEAEKRGLENIKKSVHSFDVFKDPNIVNLFKKILTKEELLSRYEILTNNAIYCLKIDTNLMIELFQTQILPAALKHQKNFAKSYDVSKNVLEEDDLIPQRQSFKRLVTLINKATQLCEELKKLRVKSENEINSHFINKFYEPIHSKNLELRLLCDELEGLVEDTLWPLPKYREILYLV